MVRWRTRDRRLRVRRAVMVAGAAGMLALTLSGTSPASAASRAPRTSEPQTTTVDYTCNKLGAGISACQWLRQTLEKQPCPVCRYNYDFKTWASMKGGTGSRGIIEIVLVWGKKASGPSTGGRGTGFGVASGKGTISGYLSKTLCTYPYYRPKFKYKYWDKAADKWIYGWSYGKWYKAPPSDPYCHGNVILQ